MATIRAALGALIAGSGNHSALSKHSRGEVADPHCGMRRAGSKLTDIQGGGSEFGGTVDDDHLSNELSASAALTETGVSVQARSRFLSAIDRLGGNAVDLLNAPLERRLEKTRAITKGEGKILDTIVQYGVDQLGASPERAERAFKSHFRKLLLEQENKDAVLIEAQADLEENPPRQSPSGDISDDFLDKFERYASEASSEQLRMMFGRLLAGEVRKPGSISKSTLHFISVLEPDVATVIKRVLPYCDAHGNCFTEFMPEPLTFSEKVLLEQSGFWSTGKVLTWKFSDANIANVTFQDGFALLHGPAGGSVQAEIAMLSRAGRELSKTLGTQFDWDSFAMKVLFLGVGKIVIYEVTNSKNGQIFPKWIFLKNNDQCFRVSVDESGNLTGHEPR